ncbi:LacI family transcriptional regulator [Actinomadura sp. ATCC 31491]|uniref:LacI family transcriptional regulator n=1 Tax=Actinomadura luzonensis TaxID=2805427 RepID=A0ABT0FVZ1_9ACTN|nr:LacI family DNA-binding transcriptional regulator [Actinomadura luzonensis]MCK2216333.1 LacI family transcriptional regulator [Actinomadura luzonensis]
MSAAARPGGKVTIAEVAQRAGVSKGAVSLAVNDKPGVSAATREKVLKAARELGWLPNQAAKSLSSASAQVSNVGLVIARPARMLGLEPFYMEFVSGIESVLAERSHSLLLRLVRDVREEIDVLDGWGRSKQISGSIMVDFTLDDPRVAAVGALHLPVIAVGHPDLTGGLPSVWTDDGAAVTEAVRYLAALGHRRLARVGGPATLGHSAIRSEAFARAVADLNLEPGRILPTDFSGEQGARATRALLASAQRPTAILYDNDIMAVAGLSVATEMGVSVPAELSLLAWDDSQLCRLTHPPLSAMSHDVFAFGAEVARRLMDLVDRGETEAGAVPTPVLVPRGTTARAR